LPLSFTGGKSAGNVVRHFNRQMIDEAVG
jgi:hypothetical protein